MLQSPTIQDGGRLGKFTRAITYDIADARHPRLIAEHVVELPTFKDRDSGKIVVAPQSEVTALSDVLFLMLCRDNNHGYGAKFSTPSRYRWIGLVDLSKASNIAAKIYDDGRPVVENGKLLDDIIPATFEPFIDINDEHELRRFGLRNGNPNGNCDRTCLSEKWESMAVVGTLDPEYPEDYFVFVANDNDFITQNGRQAGRIYRDHSGVDVDTMVLVYRVRLPGVQLR
jgi:hypothetical protein